MLTACAAGVDENGLLELPVRAHTNCVYEPPAGSTLQPCTYTLNCAPAVRLAALVVLKISFASGPPLTPISPGDGEMRYTNMSRSCTDVVESDWKSWKRM